MTNSKGRSKVDDVRIVILQRGWVAVGRYSQKGETCTLEQAAIIRRWGTTRGLGEIAEGGPTEKTVLDVCPTMRFDALAVIATIACDPTAWAKALP